MNELRHIPLNAIRQNKVALREVSQQEEGFLELVQSIRNEGVISPISVRRKTDPGDSKEFELVDGLQRFTASNEAGTGSVTFEVDPNDPNKKVVVGQYIEEQTGDPENPIRRVGIIPAQIVDRDEAELLVSQVIANVHRIETKPTEYARQIVRYLGYKPTATEAEIAIKLGKNPVWISKTMTLNKLHASIKPLVDEGTIPLLNAYSLVKLPPEEQLEWLTRAQTEKSDVFVANVTKRAKEIRDANKAGREANPEEFSPTRHLRKIPELVEEATTPKVGPALVRECKITEGLKVNAQGMEQAAALGFKLALDWFSNFDPKSQQAQKEKDSARREQDKQTKIRRAAEVSAKKEEEARKRAAEASEKAAAARELAASLPAEPVAV